LKRPFFYQPISKVLFYIACETPSLSAYSIAWLSDETLKLPVKPPASGTAVILFATGF